MARLARAVCCCMLVATAGWNRVAATADVHTTLISSTEEPTTEEPTPKTETFTGAPDTTADGIDTTPGDAEYDLDSTAGEEHRLAQLFRAGSYGAAATVTVDRSEGHDPTRVVELTYLAMRGLADLPIVMLEAARHPYKAVYFGRNDFRVAKPTLTFGRVPVLRVAGTETEPGGTLAQSATIVRYLAHVLGLDGDNLGPNHDLATVHRGHVDMWYETVNELFKSHSRWGKTFNADALKAAAESDPTTLQAAAGLTFKDTTNGGNYSAAARSLMVLQTFEAELGTGDRIHLVGHRMTYADLALWCELDKLDEVWSEWNSLGRATWHTGFRALARFKVAIEHDAGLGEFLLSDRRMPRVERRSDGDYHYLPSRRPVANPHPARGEQCCKALIAECLACQHGLTVEEICAHANVAGCPTMAHNGEF
mmetsp:Transcript_3754/g.9434  ORF Transcript_3754/g.9434 Transcript_3754/m.9434 type:complete len:423 (-) Transcript_3754:1482-2750(-)